MRAVWYDRQGPAAEVLQRGELPTPEPAIGEVRVRLHASGVNPSDVKTRAGTRGPMVFPRVIPHSDGAGTIDAIGAGVDRARIGERVWIWNAAWRRAHGSCAQFVCLPAVQAVRLPQTVSYAAGACLGIPAMTACHATLGDGSVRGQTVLVTGGAGAVGHFAIQLAKWSGARVIATVSGAAKASHAQAAGADLVINYKTTEVAAAIRAATDGAGVDRIVEVEFGGNLAVSEQVLKPGGTIATYGSVAVPQPSLPFYPLMFKHCSIQLVFVYVLSETQRARACGLIVEAMGAGRLQQAIGARFSLEETAEAHRAVESGAVVGNVVIDID